MKLKMALILVCGAVLAAECRRLTKDELTEGQEVVQSIPETERPLFLSYALGHAFMEQYRLESWEKFPFPSLLKIPKKLEKKFEALEKPDNFTSDLYVFVKSTYGLSAQDMFALILRKKVCFPHGCVDLENVGELCCPF